MAISDYELAPDVVGDDQTATAAIPLTERAGILEAMELRHTGGSWQMRDEVTISTHPQHWWGVARVIPIEPYAAQVRVIVRGTAADADVYVRARIGIQVSSVQTIAAGTTDEVACVVTLGQSTRQHEEVLSVEFKSELGDLIASDVRVTEQGRGQVSLDETSAIAFGNFMGGQVHCYMVADTSSGNWGGDSEVYDGTGGWYVGYVRSEGAACSAYTWPEEIPGQAAPPFGTVVVDTYEVGNLQLDGVAWSVEGITGEPLPAASAFAVGAYMRSSDVRAMHFAGVSAYEARPWIWAPNGVVSVGYSAGLTQGVQCDCLWTYRPGAVAIEIRSLVGSWGGQRVDNRPLALVIYDADGTIIDDETVGRITIPEVERRVGASDPGTLISWGRFGAWGGADLMYAGPAEPDWLRTQVVRSTVMLADLNATQRDEPYILRVLIGQGTGSGPARLLGVTVWERTRVEGGP